MLLRVTPRIALPGRIPVGHRIRTAPASGAGSAPLTGLAWPGNASSNGDIRLRWLESAGRMPARTSMSILVKVKYLEQDGFYATIWICEDDPTFSGTTFYVGGHPYPCDNVSDTGTGQATGGTSSTGTQQSYEIAALGTGDYINSPSNDGTGLIVTFGTEVWHFFKVELVSAGTVVRHTFYPDRLNNANFFIQQDIAIGSLVSTPADGMLALGASVWRRGMGGAGAESNDETPYSEYMRHILIYKRGLSTAEADAKFALTADDTSDPDIHYSCINPTPTDITDKSGQGNTPSWPNSNRPTLWTP